MYRKLFKQTNGKIDIRFVLVVSVALLSIASIMTYYYLFKWTAKKAPISSAIKIPELLQPKKQQAQDSILVKFEPSASSNERKKILEEESESKPEKLRKFPTYEIGVKKTEFKKTLDDLNKNKAVEYAEPNDRVYALVTPNDPSFGSQWGLPKTKAQNGWDIERGLTNEVKIAIVDTGVDLDHPDLSAKMLPGYDFVNNDSNPDDDDGHGSHVAGVAAASTNNGVGVAGMSWGAKIMPVKVLNQYGSGTYQQVSNGITYAADRGARVINLSLGGYGYSQTLKNATDYAHAKGVVVVAAAGNASSRSILYPAGNPHVVGVAATDSSDRRASFSNYNSSVDISAPGVSILSTYNGARYAYMNGTSMSAPFVSGLAGLVLSQNPSFSADQTANTMYQQSHDLGSPGRDDYFGYGRINAQTTLQRKPIISYFNIANGSYLRGNRALSANISFINGVQRVTFAIGDYEVSSHTEPPYSSSLNTRRHSNGTHTLSVNALDSANNLTTISRTIRIDNYRPRTYAPVRARAKRKGRRKIATARLHWKVRDPYTGNRAIVKVKIAKRTYSKARARRKSYYYRLYKRTKAKGLRIKNRKMRRRRLNQARIYKRRWRRIKPTYYRRVKTANYGLTTINRTRSYRWRTRSPGVYRFYVYSRDRASNSQRNVARNYLIIR